jgi:UDP:flavonoid glycosyltransferase YjiC (YdhE family)
VRVLFTSTWGYGHVFPMVPLARAFAAAGHDVLWAASEVAVPLVSAAGIDVVPAGLDTEGVQQVKQRLRAGMVGIRPEDRAAYAFPHMFGEWATPAMTGDLLELARDWRPDLMVHENAELAAPLVAAVLGVRTATHAFGGAVPPSFLIEAAMRLTALWADHGLTVPTYAGAFAGTYLDIGPPPVQTVSIDHIPQRQALRPVPYTGERTGPLPEFLERNDPRPLVYLTLGTVRNEAELLAVAVRAMVDLGARILVTVGPDGDPAMLGEQPEHVCVERWVSQTDVLPLCAAVVSHGGSGTFLGALSLGLPQLCLPQAADQFRNARAGVITGCGLALNPDEATPTALTAAVARILHDTSFRDEAAVMAKVIDEMPSPAEVVTVLERQG